MTTLRAQRIILAIGLAAVGPGSQVAHADSWSVGGGVFESLLLPGREHAGLYALVSAGLILPLGRLFLAPGLSVEASPDTHRWGVVGSLAVDWPLTSSMGVDLGAGLFTDQAGSDFGQALVLGGIGPGMSFFFGNWTISPSVSVLRVLNGPGWAMAPGVLVSRTFSP